MSNKGIIEYKESFITKIKRTLKNFLKALKKQCNQVQRENNNEMNKKMQVEQTKFTDKLKVDTKGVNAFAKRTAFLKEIEDNEEALSMLPIDKLKKLEKYYEDIVKKNEMEIKKIKMEKYQKNKSSFT